MATEALIQSSNRLGGGGSYGSSVEETTSMMSRQLAQEGGGGGADWDLSQCCDTYDILFIVLYVAYHLIIHFLWWRKIGGNGGTTYILSPLKILAVFLHEFGHGSACVLTGGKFVSITVNANESGLAVFSGGYMPIVLLGGYVGGAFWGCMFVALSGNRIGATVAAAMLILALLISLRTKPNKVVMYTVAAFSVITIGAILIDWLLFDPFLQYFTLFYGVFFGYYAIRDIWDDTVSKDSEGSDSMRCFDLYKCFGSAKNVGIIYLILAIVLQIIGLYFGLVWMSSTTVYTS